MIARLTEKHDCRGVSLVPLDYIQRAAAWVVNKRRGCGTMHYSVCV